jgi:hypothetical protein
MHSFVINVIIKYDKERWTMICMDWHHVPIHFSGTVICPGLCILMNTYEILVNNALDFTLLHITYKNYESNSVQSWYQGQVYLKQYLLLQ